MVVTIIFLDFANSNTLITNSTLVLLAGIRNCSLVSSIGDDAFAMVKFQQMAVLTTTQAPQTAYTRALLARLSVCAFVCLGEAAGALPQPLGALVSPKQRALKH